MIYRSFKMLVEKLVNFGDMRVDNLLILKLGTPCLLLEDGPFQFACLWCHAMPYYLLFSRVLFLR